MEKIKETKLSDIVLKREQNTENLKIIGKNSTFQTGNLYQTWIISQS